MKRFQLIAITFSILCSLSNAEVELEPGAYYYDGKLGGLWEGLSEVFGAGPQTNLYNNGFIIQSWGETKRLISGAFRYSMEEGGKEWLVFQLPLERSPSPSDESTCYLGRGNGVWRGCAFPIKVWLCHTGTPQKLSFAAFAPKSMEEKNGECKASGYFTQYAPKLFVRR